MNFCSLTAAMGQELYSGLAEWFWLQVSRVLGLLHRAAP